MQSFHRQPVVAVSSHSDVIVPPSGSRIRSGVVASSGSHSGVSVSSHVIPSVRRSTVREAFPRHPRFLILGSSEEEHLSRPRPDRFGPIHDRSFRSLAISDPFPGLRDRPADRLATVRRQCHFGPFPETDEEAAFRLDHDDGQFFRAMEWLMFSFQASIEVDGFLMVLTMLDHPH